MDDYVSRELDRLVSDYRDRLEWLTEDMTPIERAFLFALCAEEAEEPGGGVQMPRVRYSWPIDQRNVDLYHVAGEGIYEPLRVYPQVGFGLFTLDFVLVRIDVFEETTEGIVVVECDGHDYHERTREQASRDKRKDRELQAEGLDIFRFSGSDICRDAAGCAKETLNHLTRLEVIERCRQLDARHRGTGNLCG